MGDYAFDSVPPGAYTIEVSANGSATFSPCPVSCGRLIRFRQQSEFWKPRWYVPTTELFQRQLGGRIALVCEALIHGRPS
jgi:hypothetical protein